MHTALALFLGVIIALVLFGAVVLLNRKHALLPRTKKNVTSLETIRDKTHEVVTLPWSDGLVVNIRLRKINILKALVAGNFPNRLLQHFMGTPDKAPVHFEDGDLERIESFYETVAKASMVEPSFEEMKEKMLVPGSSAPDIPVDFYVGILTWQSGGIAAVDSFRRHRRA